MNETLEDMFQRLDRLLSARDGARAEWTVKRGYAFAVYDRHDLVLGHGISLREALYKACTSLVASARRVVDANGAAVETAPPVGEAAARSQ